MTEQISNFFTIEMIYLWLNIGIIPFWLMLVFLQQSNMARLIVRSIFPIFLLTLVNKPSTSYLVLINLYLIINIVYNEEKSKFISIFALKNM